MQIKTFVFNAFQLNTYILFDETKSCVIIDPGCSDDDENKELDDFIVSNGLIPKYCLLTHCHIDHVLGLNFVEKTYGIKTMAHEDGLPLVRTVHHYAAAFGFDVDTVNAPDTFYHEGDEIHFGNSVLKVLETPGHAAGSVCLLAESDKFVISGDVLFYESIGRTDLPTGNLDLLVKSIRTKLFMLPADFLVFPGHGHETTIGHEKLNNPFL